MGHAQPGLRSRPSLSPSPGRCPVLGLPPVPSRLPCSRMGFWDSPAWQGPALPSTQPGEPPPLPSPQPQGAASPPLLERGIISAEWMLRIHPGCLQRAHMETKPTSSALLVEDFLQHTPFHKATARYMRSSAIIAPQRVKTMQISIAVQLTLRIRLIYRQ